MMYRLLARSSTAYVMLLSLAFAPGALAGLVLLQTLQSTYLPVIDSFRVIKKQQTVSGDFVVSGTFRKRFGWCTYTGATWIATDKSGFLTRLVWDSPERNQSNTPSNRPPGYQRFGPWTIYAAGIEADTYSLVIEHTCAGFFPAKTTIGPFLPTELGAYSD